MGNYIVNNHRDKRGFEKFALRVKIILLISITFYCIPSNAQYNSIGTEVKSATKDHYHEHHKNEIGIANLPVFFVNENRFSYGLHFHYIRKIKESKFGIGVGVEKIFDKQTHQMLGVVTSYTPLHHLNFIISPGLTIEDENLKNSDFALHIETSYEFEIKDFHIGPVFEFASDVEDIHISLGLHFGIGF
ncbi:MAG: hypothetical protein IT223_12320 [Crocinitomicaceae bacterium]|nr:hypothetical protein [Crocinitomicaceae bacterium]